MQININRQRVSRYIKSHYFNRLIISRTSGSWRIYKVEKPVDIFHNTYSRHNKTLQLAYIWKYFEMLYLWTNKATSNDFQNIQSITSVCLRSSTRYINYTLFLHIVREFRSICYLKYCSRLEWFPFYVTARILLLRWVQVLITWWIIMHSNSRISAIVRAETPIQIPTLPPMSAIKLTS